MDIRAAILARTDLQVARATRDIDALAAGLNAQPPLAVQSRFVTMRTITAECGDAADGLITALSTAATVSPSVAEMLRFLRSDSGMDIGHPSAQVAVDKLARAAIFTQAQADALKGLALQPVVVTRDQVNDAMYNPDGTEK